MRWCGIVGVWILWLAAATSGQVDIARAVYRAITAAGVPIVSVSIGSQTDKTTWKVQPTELQATAQPIINAFNVTNPAHLTAEIAAAGTSVMDDRLTSAIVWTILKQMYPADTDAQTRTKFGVVRTRIIDAYTTKPWAP